LWFEFLWRRGTLLGDSRLIATTSESGGDSIDEVQGPTWQGENPKSGLNWLCLVMYAKFIHEFCSLLMHISTYLDVIIMFCIDL
jgi:hypothetical protein